jgi:hypothetical protein
MKPAAIAALALVLARPLAAADYPHIDFEYSDIWASVCGELSGEEVPRDLVAAARAMVPELERQWNRNEDALLGAAVQAAGSAFRARELHAVVSLCRTPSMSKPLVINVRRWLAPGAPPLDWAVVVGVVFHESLHWYVHALVPDSSRLLAKYADEELLVRRHLHLLALLRHVYTRLGRTGELARIMEADRRLPRPAYKRAWEIVNAEGDAPFVSELKR